VSSDSRSQPHHIERFLLKVHDVIATGQPSRQGRKRAVTFCQGSKSRIARGGSLRVFSLRYSTSTRTSFRERFTLTTVSTTSMNTCRFSSGAARTT
jgi:hypothetical protein